MSDKQTLEKEIRAVLASESDAIALSNKLFGPSGLFNELAADKTARSDVAQTPLFREAQRRLSELRRREARQFSQAVEQTQHNSPSAPDRLLKFEQS